MTVLDLLDNFSSKMMFLNSNKSFQSLGSAYSYRMDLENFRHFSKTVLKTRLITKETTYTLVFVKYLVVSFRSHSIKAFSVFLEDSLRIILET
jgi:hypothetical protein